MFFIRNLGLPFIIVAAGPAAVLLLAAMCQPGGPLAPWSVSVRAGLPLLMLLPLSGALWAAWRLLQIGRWRRGTLRGDCSHCQGIVASGRCRMCGQRQ